MKVSHQNPPYICSCSDPAVKPKNPVWRCVSKSPGQESSLGLEWVFRDTHQWLTLGLFFIASSSQQYQTHNQVVEVKAFGRASKRGVDHLEWEAERGSVFNARQKLYNWVLLKFWSNNILICAMTRTFGSTGFNLTDSPAAMTTHHHRSTTVGAQFRLQASQNCPVQ